MKKLKKMAKNWELADQFGGQKGGSNSDSRVPPRETDKTAKIEPAILGTKIQKLPKVYGFLGGVWDF